MKIAWFLTWGGYVTLCVVNETFIFKKLVTKNNKGTKILGVTIDDKLNFKSHVTELSKITSKNLGLSNHLNDTKKKKFVLISVINSQFHYCHFMGNF